MSETCATCHGLRWTCEHHPDQPPNHDNCGANAVPCPDCQATDGTPVQGWISIDRIEEEIVRDGVPPAPRAPATRRT